MHNKIFCHFFHGNPGLFYLRICLIFTMTWAFQFNALSQELDRTDLIKNLIQESMEEGDIPGLSLVIIDGEEASVHNYGFADVEQRSRVTNKTLFELGSNTKAYTALAILKLVQDGKLDLDYHVSDYLPWFQVLHEGTRAKISLRQLIHHTSGIPWSTISLIPASDTRDALRQTVERINGIALITIPGWKLEYATINYDVLALILEEVTGMPYEAYVQQEIFTPLGLSSTTVGTPMASDQMATGYKISFFKPRPYTPPPFRGNHAAGYAISNAEDMTAWLRYQLDLNSDPFDSLIRLSHQRDETVRPLNLSSYAYGWEVSLSGNRIIDHAGLNPNFSSYLAFNKKEKIGIALMTNSNSQQTQKLGKNLMNVLTGRDIQTHQISGDPMDAQFGVITIVLGLFLLVVLVFVGFVVFRIITGKRSYESISRKKSIELLVMLLVMLPYFYGIYIIPEALADFTWEAIPVWTASSFQITLVIASVAIMMGFLAHVLSSLFPEENEYLKDAPLIILFSILSGLSNVAAILLITSSINSNMQLKYQLFYLSLTVLVYLIGVKLVRTKMTYLTRNAVFKLRIKLVNLIFKTSFERFEKIDNGRVYTTLNGDVGQLGQSANMIVNIITNLITVIGSFVYMASLSFWSTAATTFIVLLLCGVYYYVSKNTQHLFEESRETNTVYMGLLNEMISGFKELSLHLKKRLTFKQDIARSADEFRVKSARANIKFINAFLIGESLLLFTLAVVAFAIQRIFPDVETYVIVGFIIILLYIMGPLNAILLAIPQAMQLRIAQNRINDLIRDLESSQDLEGMLGDLTKDELLVDSFVAKSITYEYGGEEHNFAVGPIDLEIKKGEVIFIIGGNGSGKSTLAKLLTGLYHPHQGEIQINGKTIHPSRLGEYFSTVLSPFHLFKKIYSLDEGEQKESVNQYFDLLEIQDKVELVDNAYSTVNLSSGQRKRVALFQCYLEDKPIFLFDEWAADQDPTFRKIFYHELIPKMKEQGKTVIAITHDDQYFHAADRIYKMDAGQFKPLTSFMDSV